LNAIIKINEQTTTGDEAGKQVVVSVKSEEEAAGYCKVCFHGFTSEKGNTFLERCHLHAPFTNGMTLLPMSAMVFNNFS